MHVSNGGWVVQPLTRELPCVLTTGAAEKMERTSPYLISYSTRENGVALLESTQQFRCAPRVGNTHSAPTFYTVLKIRLSNYSAYS